MTGRPFDTVCDALHPGENFDNLEDAPWYGDAVYPSFSEAEYSRRREALRAAMREMGLDCLIVPGSMNNGSMGYGMVWLTGHLDARALAQYVVFPLEGEPTLICSMGGAHIWSTRKACAVKDVRAGGGGRFGKVMIERLRELGLADGTIGLASANSEGRANEYLPVNYYLELREALPEAKLELEQEMLAREVAIYADRCDISEELTRLRCHLDHFESMCDSNQHAGRKLDFLAQEMLREANTIGSKSNDATISRHIIEVKALIDRLKEQVQNVE